MHNTSRAQEMSDALDRAKAAMMLDMPIWYRIQYGRVCTTTHRMCVGCGHVSLEGTVSRVAECWLCAMIENSPCEPIPGVGTDGDGVWCPQCRAKPVKGSLNGKVKKDGRGCMYEEEMRRERESNDRKRLEEEAMRRERKKNELERVQKDRKRRGKKSVVSASARRT